MTPTPENEAAKELKPCPFCGETKIDYETTITERTIRCTRCSAKIVRDTSTVLPEHVWNSRQAGNSAPSGWVAIETEDDLPKKNGKYAVIHKNGMWSAEWFNPDVRVVEAWLKYFTHYQKITPPEPAEDSKP